MIKYCHRLVNLITEFPLLKNAFSCCKDLHSKGKTSWYSFIDILLKILRRYAVLVTLLVTLKTTLRRVLINVTLIRFA